MVQYTPDPLVQRGHKNGDVSQSWHIHRWQTVTERQSKRGIGSLVEEIRKELLAWLKDNNFLKEVEVHVFPSDFQGGESVKIEFFPGEEAGALPSDFCDRFSAYLKGAFWDFVSKVIEKVRLGWNNFRIRPAQRGRTTDEYGVFLEPRAV